jgi:hypothetical protein
MLLLLLSNCHAIECVEHGPNHFGIRNACGLTPEILKKKKNPKKSKRPKRRRKES